MDSSQSAEESHETLGKNCSANIFDSAIVPVNIASCVHELQHAVLKLGKVDRLFVVPGLRNDF